MGAWDVQPWDNDDAADWFSSFFEGIGADARIESAFQHEDDDKYDLMRAASYILQVLGRVYVWPGDVNRLDSHLDKAILELSKMVDPVSEAHAE